MKKPLKVIHIELLTPPPEYKKHYYFGSIAALYDKLPNEVVGITMRSLWNVLSKAGEYSNKKSIIRIGVLQTKESKRGIKAKEVEV